MKKVYILTAPWNDVILEHAFLSDEQADQVASDLNNRDRFGERYWKVEELHLVDHGEDLDLNEVRT